MRMVPGVRKNESIPALSNVQRHDERVRHPRVGTGRLLRLNSIAQIGRPPVSAVDELRPFARHERNFRPILERHRGVVSARYRTPCDSVLREGCRRTALSVGSTGKDLGRLERTVRDAPCPPLQHPSAPLDVPLPAPFGRLVVPLSNIRWYSTCQLPRNCNVDVRQRGSKRSNRDSIDI